MLLALLALVITLATVAEIVLDRRQIAHVRAHKGVVPEAFADKVTPEEHRRAADYTVARAGVTIAGRLVTLALWLFWLFAGISLLHGAIADLGLGPVLSGSLLILAILLIDSVVELPAGIVRTFVVEARFGFNKMTPGLFALDWLKGTVLSLALAFVLSFGLLWLMASLQGPWWLWGWAGFLAFAAAMMVIFPLWIAPLFNKFTPLRDGELKSAVEALLTRAGFVASGLFVMDGSKRSTHGNAYFAGMGKAKRIVFFDTLIERLTVPEIEAVLAHELGHFKHHDIVMGFARLAVMALAVFWWLGVAAKAPWLGPALGLPAGDAVGLIVAFACLTPLEVIAGPVGNALSQRAENRADAFAAGFTGGGAALSSALMKLSRDNAATLTPDPVYVLFRYSHPPVSERLKRLREAAPAE